MTTKTTITALLRNQWFRDALSNWLEPYFEPALCDCHGHTTLEKVINECSTCHKNITLVKR